VHATAAVAARQLPGVCTFALQPTKQRENANWSRIAQLTRSDRKASALARCGSCWAIIDRVRDSEPRGAGPAASEAVWTAERTNAFNKLYLQTDSRLLPRRRRGRTTCTPRGTRCRSVARSHLIPVYRPPHLAVEAQQPSPQHRLGVRQSLNCPLVELPLRPVRTKCRQAHHHTIDASLFSRLEQRDANRTPSPYREANGLVHDRPEVEASRRRGRRGGRRSVPPGGLRLPRDARRRDPRPEVRIGRIFATRGPRCGVAASESTATPHAPKEFDIQRGGRARRLVCTPPLFSCFSPVNTEAVGGRFCYLVQRTICSRRQPKN
jgi:hypothetical protein